MMYSYKDLSELAGYTARVAQLLDTMSDIQGGKFEKELISSAKEEQNAQRMLFLDAFSDDVDLCIHSPEVTRQDCRF